MVCYPCLVEGHCTLEPANGTAAETNPNCDLWNWNGIKEDQRPSNGIQQPLFQPWKRQHHVPSNQLACYRDSPDYKYGLYRTTIRQRLRHTLATSNVGKHPQVISEDDTILMSHDDFATSADASYQTAPKVTTLACFAKRNRAQSWGMSWTA